MKSVIDASAERVTRGNPHLQSRGKLNTDHPPCFVQTGQAGPSLFPFRSNLNSPPCASPCAAPGRWEHWTRVDEKWAVFRQRDCSQCEGLLSVGGDVISGLQLSLNWNTGCCLHLFLQKCRLRLQTEGCSECLYYAGMQPYIFASIHKVSMLAALFSPPPRRLLYALTPVGWCVASLCAGLCKNYWMVRCSLVGGWREGRGETDQIQTNGNSYLHQHLKKGLVF